MRRIVIAGQALTARSLAQLTGAPLRQPGSQVVPAATSAPEDTSAVPGPHWGEDGEPRGDNPLLESPEDQTRPHVQPQPDESSEEARPSPVKRRR